MQEDGPRLRKLKEVYKRAVQEILSGEDAMCSEAAVSESRDSFYGNASNHTSSESIKKAFLDMRQQLGEILKSKMRTVGLDVKLNALDADIRDWRVSYQDLRNPEYIREIFCSHAVDPKANFMKRAEEMLEEAGKQEKQLESEISELRKKIAVLEAENGEFEREYQRIVNELAGVCDD